MTIRKLWYFAIQVMLLEHNLSYDYPSVAATESTEGYNTAYATPRLRSETPAPTTYWRPCVKTFNSTFETFVREEDEGEGSGTVNICLVAVWYD